jgi:hypothetical protein
MKEDDDDNSPPGTTKGLCHVIHSLPSDDGSKQSNPYYEAHIGGSRLKNIAEFKL